MSALSGLAGAGLFVTGITWIGFYPAFFAVATTNQTISSACTIIGFVFGVVGNGTLLRRIDRPARVCALVLLAFSTIAYIVCTVFGIIETYDVTRNGSVETAPLGFYFASWIVASLCALTQAITSILLLAAIRSDRKCAYCADNGGVAASRRVPVVSRTRRRAPKSRAHIRQGA